MSDIGKIFMNGRSQAVRLPKAYRFNAKEVRIRRDPNNPDDLIFSPRRTTWEDWEAFFRLADEAKDEAKDFLIDRRNPQMKPRDVF